jgi:Kef-type K+ transport system membrane component KefB
LTPGAAARRHLGIIAALLAGKWIAAAIGVRAFEYVPAARSTMWALTLPQVAATLAAAVVAFDTRNAAGQRLLDGTMLNAVLVLMLATSVLGPVLTERFAPRMLQSQRPVAGGGQSGGSEHRIS